MDIPQCCIVSGDNRPKSPFVRHELALASRALYVKTRGERGREEKAERHANSCAVPFAERLLKRARFAISSFTVTYKKTFFLRGS